MTAAAKSYFRYHLRSKWKLLLCIIVIALVLTAWNSAEQKYEGTRYVNYYCTLGISLAVLVVCSCILPITEFSIFKKRRNLDCFYGLPISRRQEIKLAELRTAATKPMSSFLNVMLLTLFQVLCCISYLYGVNPEHAGSVVVGFGGIVFCQWALLLFYIIIKKPSFEIETIAFFLCTMGMAAICAVKPSEAVKQLIAMVMGICLYLGIGWSLRDLERAKRLRYYAAFAGVAFLLITMVFGKEYHGAKNWLVIAGMSFQPSELSKVCFVLVGASAMDRIMNKRNLLLFIGYTLVICACLAVMNDFGTALIFFVAFLLIAYMRSGSVGTLALACTSLGFAGVIALKIAPHALRRFSNWRHIWEDPLNAGYQQTRALMCISAGGLLGLGAGQGWMQNLFAADSDVVFATISEEWGLIMAVLAVLSAL